MHTDAPTPTPPEPKWATDVIDSGAAGSLVVRGAVLRVLGYGAGAVLGLATAVILTRYLGVDRFGQYVTIISVATLAVMITDAGVANLATREFVARDEARDVLMRDLLGIRVALIGAAIAGAAIFAVAAGYSGELVLGTVLAATGLGIAAIQTFGAVPLAVRLEYGRVTAIELARQVSLAALIVFAVLAGAGLVPILAALIPSSVLALVMTVRVAGPALPRRPAFAARRARPLIRNTAVFSIATGLGVAYAFAAQIVTSLVAGAYETGLFAAAFRLFAVISSAGGLLINSAFPVLARSAYNDHDRLRYALQRLLDVAVVLGTGATIAATVGAPFIIGVMAGADYEGSVEILRVAGGAFLASFILAVLGYALISLRLHAALVVANGVALAVMVVLTAVLASIDGGRGAALAVLLGEITLAAGLWIGLTRGPLDVTPRVGNSVRVVPVAAAACTPLLLPVANWLQLALALAVYAAGVLLVKAIPAELIAMMRRRG